ncbi:MAG: S24 family peptidase [Candidatus Saccharimonadales bacterium]
MKKGSVEDGLVYHAGFPNAGEDQHGVSLSLDALVVKHRASTYFWRLESEVAELRWPAGTIIVVDRALPLREGRMVVAIVDEAFVIARYRKTGLYDLLGSRLDDNSSVWGVITYVVSAVEG